jgi:hypothetical protein
MFEDKYCYHCGKIFVSANSNRRFCNSKCSNLSAKHTKQKEAKQSIRFKKPKGLQIYEMYKSGKSKIFVMEHFCINNKAFCNAVLFYSKKEIKTDK